jgi:hypothetical protein
VAIASENARGLPEESAQGDVQDPDLASECGGVDGRGVRGYAEEGLEVDVDVEGCPGRASPTSISKEERLTLTPLAIDDLLPPHLP